MAELTAQRLRELVHYSPERGVFTRRIDAHKGRHKAGERIGGINPVLGYEMFGVDKHKVYAHRAAFLYMTGEWPSEQIDHINGIRHDNRWTNLREVTFSVNKQNRRVARAGNKSGLLGVKTTKCGFQARIAVNKRQITIGTFKTAALAHEAYVLAKRQLHEGCTL